MDYQVFEKRVLELLFKTPDRLTAQVAAYKIGLPVDDARTMLEKMAAHEVVTMETDDNGAIYFDLAHRPPPTGEPLSWMQAQRPGPAPVPMPMPMVRYAPAPVMVPVVAGAPVMVVEPEKSVAASLVLSFFFGPLGMFYSTVTGGVVMLTAGMLFVALTLGFGAVLVWPACMLWAGLSASAHNTKVRNQRQAWHAAHAHMHHMQQHLMASRALPPGR